MTIDITRTIFQILGFIAIWIIFIIQIKRIKENRKNLGYKLAIGFWMMHAIAFYIAVFLVLLFPDTFTSHNFTTWSSGLRFHAYTTIAAIEVSRYKLEKLEEAAEKDNMEALWKILG